MADTNKNEPPWPELTFAEVVEAARLTHHYLTVLGGEVVFGSEAREASRFLLDFAEMGPFYRDHGAIARERLRKTVHTLNVALAENPHLRVTMGDEGVTIRINTG